MTPDEMANLHAAAFTMSRPWTSDEFADLLAQKFCFACGDTRCFALIRVVADEAELLTIATHPYNQRQGLASALMADWLPLATVRGATRAFLEVASDNAPAITLYARSGFAISGRRPGYYRRAGLESVDALLMTRDLTQG